MKLTPWFDGSVKPARPGVYQRKYGIGVYYAKWDGRNWFIGMDNPKWASLAMPKSYTPNLPWRGLAEKPE